VQTKRQNANSAPLARSFDLYVPTIAKSVTTESQCSITTAPTSTPELANEITVTSFLS
jgi:hypothetical protein